MIMKIVSVMVVFVTMVSLFGCDHYRPPLMLPNSPRTPFVNLKRFRLALLNFGEGQLAQALPAVLLTALEQTGRFTVFEGGGIRTSGDKFKDAAITEATARESVDGYLSGTITSESATEVCFDIRLENAVNHAVMFTRATCTKYRSGNGVMVPERDAINRLADEVSRSIKQIGHARVTSVDSRVIYLNKGSSAGVVEGMVAYLVASAETVTDNQIHLSVFKYTGIDPSSVSSDGALVVGNLYIIAVEDKYSVGWLYDGDYALPGDSVFFK